MEKFYYLQKSYSISLLARVFKIRFYYFAETKDITIKFNNIIIDKKQTSLNITIKESPITEYECYCVYDRVHKLIEESKGKVFIAKGIAYTKQELIDKLHE